MNGTNSHLIQSGEVNFTDENFVLSSGSFRLFFYNNCSDILENYTSSLFTVDNYIKLIEIDFGGNVTIYFNFTVTISIYGDDENYYLGVCDSNLTDDNDNVLFSYNTSNGTASSSIYLEQTTTIKLKTTCEGFTGLSETLTPNPLLYTISLENETNELVSESDANTTFYAIIQVVDSNGIIEDTNFNSGKYPVHIRLVNRDSDYSGFSVYYNDSETITTDGEFSAYTTAGVLNVSMQVLSSGLFGVEVVENNDPDIQSENSNITVTNFFKSFDVSIDETTVYLPTDFNITLYGSDDNEFILDKNVTIIDSNDSNNNYSCANNRGKCLINGLMLYSVENYTFESSDLNGSFDVRGLSIKIHVDSFDYSVINI